MGTNVPLIAEERRSTPIYTFERNIFDAGKFICRYTKKKKKKRFLIQRGKRIAFVI